VTLTARPARECDNYRTNLNGFREYASAATPQGPDMNLRRTRNAKIVATVGPASSDRETLRRLFLAGVDVFRLNFSHGNLVA